MAGPNAKKRSHQEYSLKGRMKAQRPLGKHKKQKHYHSDSDEDDEKPTEPNKSFKPVDLIDSEDDLDNAVVDDGASSAGSGSDSESAQSDSEGDDDKTSTRDKLTKRKTAPTKAAQSKAKKAKQVEEHDKDAEESDSEDEELEENDEFDIDLEDDSDAEDNDDDDDDDDTLSVSKKPKSKRNDPGAFATSLSKILSTKLPTTRRADPVLSRSVDAHKAAQAITDSVLEGKAKKQLRVQKLAALEKGRVRNVLVASRNEATGELEATTGQVMEKERQLRKVAQRGVVKLFNAVRAAQVRGVEAEREARKDGFVGVSSRKDKVTDMSKKGFLDLIASGGGYLKKGPIEEA